MESVYKVVNAANFSKIPIIPSSYDWDVDQTNILCSYDNVSSLSIYLFQLLVWLFGIFWHFLGRNNNGFMSTKVLHHLRLQYKVLNRLGQNVKQGQISSFDHFQFHESGPELKRTISGHLNEMIETEDPTVRWFESINYDVKFDIWIYC